jgi:hypothetical protein
MVSQSLCQFVAVIHPNETSRKGLAPSLGERSGRRVGDFSVARLVFKVEKLLVALGGVPELEGGVLFDR